MKYMEHVAVSWPSTHEKIRLREKPWLSDEVRARLRGTGRDLYGEYPYVKTDEEREEWQEAREEEMPEGEVEEREAEEVEEGVPEEEEEELAKEE